jgi:peptide-methionine (R)-S-oxide reductase
MDANRRKWLAVGGLGALGYAALALRGAGTGVAEAGGPAPAVFAVTHSKEEWRSLLTPQQYAVLREQATERPYSSPLNGEHRDGIFTCAGCMLDLFSSKTKFESGTGWPSFWEPLPGAVRKQSDTSYGVSRTEVQCERCGGHLGHVFADGPKPTGLRYCMNGVAMAFRTVNA